MRDVFIGVGGDAMSAEDLGFLSEEDMVKVSSSMTKIETRRLKVALDSGEAKDANVGHVATSLETFDSF